MLSSDDAMLESVGNRLMHYSPQYFEFLRAVLPGSEVACLTALRDGNPVGVLPYAAKRDVVLGTVINALPFFGSHGGPLAAHGDDEVVMALAVTFADLLAERNAASATIIESPFVPLADSVVAALGMEATDDRIGQVTPLPAGTPDVDAALMALFHQKTRNAVRKGQKLGQTVERRDDAESWRWMQGVHERSITALGGMPKSNAVFDALRAAFGDAARLYVGSVDGRPLSGVVVIVYRGTVEYFTPVVEASERDTQALSATIFEVMRALAAEGCTLWNWGGTWRSQEGVYRFKSRWGAEDHPYRYFNCVRDPALRAVPRAAAAVAFPNFYLYRY